MDLLVPSFFKIFQVKHSADCRVVIAKEAYCSMAIQASVEAVVVVVYPQHPVD
jgi:hypothetical protein